jgi:transcription antitermination factor NusG
MPLLSIEPFIHPEDLLDQPLQSLSAEGRFWVLHTRPRAEKTLARQLFDRGVPYFLPTYRREWQKSGRRFRSYLPLFPGYVFLFGNNEQRVATLETNLVAMVLPVRDQIQLHADLQRVQRLISAGLSVAPEQRLEPGDRVQLIKGPLAGLEGTVLRRGTQLRIVVEVKMLQSAVSAEVEGWMLQHAPQQPSVPAACA